jgi:hypothetical protein
MLEKESDKEASFNFQLEILKKELDILNNTIDKIDTLTQGLKNWTIGLWSGAIILAFGANGTTNFKGEFLLPALIPFLFWLLDAWWRRTQRGFIYRVEKISDFLNDPNYFESFKEKRIIGLRLYDLRGRKTGNITDYNKFVSPKKTFLFKSVGLFYFGLIIFSIALQIFAALRK